MTTRWLSVSLTHTQVLHDITKHVEIDRLFIKYEEGIICAPYVSIIEQVAGILTKGLLRQPFELLISNLDMTDIFAPTLGGVDKSATITKK